MKLRGALKDFDRQLDNNIPVANLMTKIIEDDDKSMVDLFKRAAKEPKLKEYVKRNSDIFYMMPSILDQPKTKSIHPCAMVITPKVLTSNEWFPNRVQKGMVVSEWDGGEIEDAGFLKQDILGLLQIDKIAEILRLIEKNGKEAPDIYHLPEDPEVYRYFSNGWNGDIFQMGTDSLSNYTRYMKPQVLNDLIAVVALHRPGPMEKHYHEIYVKCKNEGREPKYLWGTEEITKDTFGLLIYQEEVLEVCQKLGGLTLVEADDVRRAMGKKDLKYLSIWEDKLREGYLKNGATEEQFDEAWGVMIEFASYGFNKCVSGETKIYSIGRRKNLYHPTVEEMYLLKNDLDYAKAKNKMPLRSKYLKSYPTGFSLNDSNKLIKNKIKDIRLEGRRETFKLTLKNGAQIKTTFNHKFPTSNGEKILVDIDISKDLIYYNIGHKAQDTTFRFTNKNEARVTEYHNCENVEQFQDNFPKKGREGFVKKPEKSTNFLKLKYYKENVKKDFCEICDTKNAKRLEVHHKDNNHGNNEESNLQTVCVSCHKKAHYKLGRTKVGERGLYTKLVGIKSIESAGYENVYDVEMEAPYHTFTTNEGIVTSNSHAACYAITGYIGQWLKVHFPLEFWTVALSHADEKDTLKYLSEIFMSKNIKISPPDINQSGVITTSDQKTNTIYWGIESIKGIGETTADQIIRLRKKGGEYKSFADFYFRNTFTGSKVKKQTFEALISSGAFDLLYRFEDFEEKRGLLINRYRKYKKVKVGNPKTDPYTIGQLHEKWWWQLMQKRLTGFIFVDYGILCNELGIETVPANDRELGLSQNRGIFRSFGGYVVECKIRQSVKGKFAAILIESNYKLYRLMLWNDTYEIYKDELKNIEKSFVIFNAQIRYEDKWVKGNQFTLQENSKFIVLN